MAETIYNLDRLGGDQHAHSKTPTSVAQSSILRLRRPANRHSITKTWRHICVKSSTFQSLFGQTILLCNRVSITIVYLCFTFTVIESLWVLLPTYVNSIPTTHLPGLNITGLIDYIHCNRIIVETSMWHGILRQACNIPASKTHAMCRQPQPTNNN